MKDIAIPHAVRSQWATKLAVLRGWASDDEQSKVPDPAFVIEYIRECMSKGIDPRRQALIDRGLEPDRCPTCDRKMRLEPLPIPQDVVVEGGRARAGPENEVNTQ